MKPFELLKAPLKGINLIEAGAGTGKTYNIEGLFVRLILELQLQVDQILVLTFTNAATEELKDRIRTKLVQVKEAFTGGYSEDPFIHTLVGTHSDPKAARIRIHEALIDFDKAAIFTIHGFCQRIIHENAFETHNLFDTELVTNQTGLIQQVVDDFWRKTYYTAPVELIGFSLEKVKGPEYFIRLLEKAKIPDVKIVPDLPEPSLGTLQPFREALDALKKAWPVSREPVIRRLMDPALNANIYGRFTAGVNHPEISDRALRVTSLAKAMDYLVHPQSPGFPLFDNFEKFTAAKLAKATKKNNTPPKHAFFDLCDTVFTRGELLKSELEQYLMFLKGRLFDFAGSELRKRKKEKNIQYFDDLLITVQNALKTANEGQLTAGIRQKYRAALVDEFQDTDSTQYDILTRLFSHENSLLFMIGDPKQSIYSFRGADIFSYMDAARSTDTKFTLIENWRSDPGLIVAVNTLFSSVKVPFVFDEIPFKEGKPARFRQGPEPAKFKGAPLILWYLDPDKTAATEKPINKPEAVGLIAVAVGDEIYRLISGTTAVAPGDIAVLVRTNAQAQRIKDILTDRNVPSVLYTSANIFDSREALEIKRILAGIAHPADISRLKAAFATDIMGVRARDLISGDLESRWWETRLSRFRDYFQLWDRHGFIRMFRFFLARESVKDRLLGFSDGERRLTNVMHLAELLHRQSTQKNAGMTGLLKWLGEQRNPSSPRLDEDQLRLESDEQAVKIVTVHKSKGLEYPVVFCPFGWESSLIKSREFAFHDIDNDLRLTVDIGSELRSKNIALGQNELLSENLRLLYVALTRAKQRCYLAWGRINTAETSALAYLLHGGENEMTASSTDDVTRLLKKNFTAKTNAELRDDLYRLAARSQDSIQIIDLPVPREPDAVLTVDRYKNEQLFCRKFAGKVDRSWKISSYSALVSTSPADADQPDRDASLFWLEQDLTTESEDLEAVKARDESTIFSFPGGTRAGSFFHDVFEHLDFAEDNSEHLNRLVENKLQQYGFDQKWTKTVCRAARNVLSIPLGPETWKFRMSSISMGDRISEMEFYFPLNPVTPDSLKRIYEKLNGSEMYMDFPEQLEKLSFAPSSGFMKGYIDLVFRHHGGFYLVDWKSNHLGSTLKNYDRSSLNRTMAAEYYFLQYHIYILALHQYLRLHQPDYRYENNFGGVFYIFIRGVDDSLDPQYGVFFDLPDPDLIHGLGKTLIPGYNT